MIDNFQKDYAEKKDSPARIVYRINTLFIQDLSN